MTDWYCSSVAYAAVTAWAASTTLGVGAIRRQLATPAVGSERCFRVSAITTGVTGGTEPTWVITKAGTTTDGGVTWTECSGNSAQQQVGGVTNTWTAPLARVETGASFMAAGDRLFVSSDHTQTRAAFFSITSPGSTCAFVSVNRTTGNVPPLAADITNGAAVILTNSGVSLTISGGGDWAGFSFTVGAGTDSGSNVSVAAGANVFFRFRNCSFIVGSTATCAIILASATTLGRILYDNLTLTFAGTLSSVVISGGRTVIRGGSVTGSAPGVLLSASGSASVDIYGFDFSLLGSGKTLLASGATFDELTLVDCKLGAGAAIVGAMSASSDQYRINVINCDSGATGYRNEWHRTAGDITTETTITRTGGSTDGVQKVSHKLTSNVNATILCPLEEPDIYIWNTATGVSKTATIELISSASLNNNDIWLELDYLGSASSPLASIGLSDPATALTAASAVTTSTANWDSSPATPVKQKLQVTFTPQMVGLIRAKVRLGKVSTTVYVDPLITVS